MHSHLKAQNFASEYFKRIIEIIFRLTRLSLIAKSRHQLINDFATLKLDKFVGRF